MKLRHLLEYQNSEPGLMVFPRTREDNLRLTRWLDDADYYAEWNAEGYWLFPEAPEGYDELERELEQEFSMHDINARFEGIFNW